MISNKSLDLFHKAAREIPAYKNFLVRYDLRPDSIRTLEDYSRIPLISKKSYLQQNQLTDMMWEKDLNGSLVFCSTSGSTGKPYYFPRNEELSVQYSHLLTDFLDYSSYGKGSTLVLIGFGMGVWIGGIITLRAFEIAANRSEANVSILPVGYNKNELVKALQELSPQYSQTVIVGYPPFIKELTDEAEDLGVNLKKLNIRFLFAAEAFTETFRNYVCEKAGVQNPLLDTLNIYGTADIGAMAYETPMSILVRRIVIEDPMLQKDVFKQIEKTPTLAQFNPKYIEFEEVDGEIVLTGDAALPLVRYAVGDHGGVFTFENLERTLRHYGVNLAEECEKANISNTIIKHPFVYVYERTDFATSLHGIIIYPEFIKEGLLKPECTEYFTERFTMSTKTDIYHNQFLKVNVELKPNTELTEELVKLAELKIKESLIEKSSEFSEISKSKASSDLIKVVLWHNGHPKYFSPGVKQKWVEKA